MFLMFLKKSMHNFMGFTGFRWMKYKSIHKMEMFLDRFFNTLWHYLKFEKTYNENIHMHDRSYAAMQRKKVHFRNFSCCSHTHNTLIPNTQHKKVLLPFLTKSIFHQNDFKCNFMLHLHFAVCPNPINQTLISPPLYCKLKWHPSNTRGAICRSSVVANALFATTDSETDFVRNLCYYYGERQLALELLDSAALYE